MEKILQNIKTLCNSTTKFIVRIPLISSVNDSIENMQAVAELIKDAKNLLRVELLTYNTYAGAKYAWLDKAYKPDFDTHKKPLIHDVFSQFKIPYIVL